MSNNSISTAQVFALCQSQSQFPIDFNDAWQWIGYSRKDNAKRGLLSCGFEEGIDLLIDEGLGTLDDPKVEERIMLTVDCFKMWAMMAATEKGRDARLYFLQCEKQLKQVNQSLAVKAKSMLDLSESELGRLKAYRISVERGMSPDANLMRDIDPAFFQAPSGAVIYAERFALVKAAEDMLLSYETLMSAGSVGYDSEDIAWCQKLVSGAKEVITSVEAEDFWLNYKTEFDEFESSQLALVGGETKQIEEAGISRKAVAQKAFKFQQESINSAREMISKSRSRKTKI